MKREERKPTSKKGDSHPKSEGHSSATSKPRVQKNADPADIRDDEDSGDDTQRRIRYQHGYGVILLIASFKSELPYCNLWCEHHDDYLAEKDGMYDSIQVKSQTPERGYWELASDGFVAAINKFCNLESKFPKRIDRFKFVSNTRCLKSVAKTKKHRSPITLLKCIEEAEKLSDLEACFQDAVTSLAKKCDVEPASLLEILKRVDLVTGPTLDDFEASISCNHLPTIDACSKLVPAQIDKIRDELIQKVSEASSLSVADPAKHWFCLNGPVDYDPVIKAKTLSPSIVEEILSQHRPLPFRFSPIENLIERELKSGTLSKFDRKLRRGGLDDQVETMKRRTISSESHLIGLASRKPDDIQAILNQLIAFVQGTCDDAKLLASSDSESNWGPDMLRRVVGKLEKTAETNSDMVFGESYELLMGIAGLLTEECTVWWSEKFNLDEVNE